MTKKELARICIDRLKKEYPRSECTLDYDHAWQLLVSVRLAAQCTDARVNVVVQDLFARYPSVEALAAAEPEEIEAIVKPCGLGRSKARDISACMRKLRDEYGGKVPSDFDALLSLPGVGRKTANCVMCEAFRDPQGIAVDTHVFRIAHRLNFCGPAAKTPEKVEDALLRLYPRDQWLYINHQWVHFGREFCRAKKPRCSECFISDLCPSFPEKDSV